MVEFRAEILAAKIADYRNRLNLTQTALAELADIPIPSLQDLEYGKNKSPGVENLLKVASALGITLEELLGLENAYSAKPILADVGAVAAFLSKFAGLSPTLQLVVMAIVHKDPQMVENSPEIEDQVVPLLKALR